MGGGGASPKDGLFRIVEDNNLVIIGFHIFISYIYKHH